MPKTIADWTDEISDIWHCLCVARDELRHCKQWASNLGYADSQLGAVDYELEVRLAQDEVDRLERLHSERKRRFAAWQTLMANNALRRGETDRL